MKNHIKFFFSNETFPILFLQTNVLSNSYTKQFSFQYNKLKLLGVFEKENVQVVYGKKALYYSVFHLFPLIYMLVDADFPSISD